MPLHGDILFLVKAIHGHPLTPADFFKLGREGGRLEGNPGDAPISYKCAGLQPGEIPSYIIVGHYTPH